MVPEVLMMPGVLMGLPERPQGGMPVKATWLVALAG
jgi:hypothetical protein